MTYNPNQPRVPAGSPDGGQWASAGGGGSGFGGARAVPENIAKMSDEELLKRKREIQARKNQLDTMEGHVDSELEYRASGAIFASPNIGEGSMDVKGAQREFGSESQSRFREVSGKIDSAVGIKGNVRDAVGAWSDGAENSTVTLIGKGTPEQIRTAAAMRGLIGEQKAVIPFAIQKGGGQRMVTFDVSERDASSLSKQLAQSGLEYHTLVPTAKGHRVMLFEDAPTRKSLNTARAAASFYGAADSVRSVRGTGEFLGSWSDRMEGRAAYEGVIRDWAKGSPSRAAQWNRIADDWKFTVTPKPDAISP